MAAKARKAGITWIALQAVWQHETGVTRRDDLTRLHLYADALQDQGIRVWVWGYPYAGREADFAAGMADAAAVTEADGLLLDPELPYRGRPEAARDLLVEVLDVMDESLGIGVTSYGLQKFHPRFPWAEWAHVGFGSPQLYTVSDALFKRGMAEWRARWDLVIPSIAAYGSKDESELPARLRLAGSSCILWSWRQLSGREWADLEFSRS